MNNNFIRKDNLKVINQALVDLSCPSNISLMWNFGSLLGLVYLIQVLTGLFLTFHYVASIEMAFDSVIHIMRDVGSGWVLRYSHVNGASLFFVFIYVHISRGVYFFSFKKTMVWVSGIIILLVLMMVAFMGYILPWGQMSFWGATVITNLISSIPIWGETIVFWVWGGFSINSATLNRFFSFHFVFPFLIAVLILAHLAFLHSYGSSNPLGLDSSYDKIFFYPYFMIKDLLGFGAAAGVFVGGLMFFPFLVSDPENFIAANSLVTPVHIQPEWYFLFSYAILRSIPNKLGGVLALALSILILSILTVCHSKFNSFGFYPMGDWLALSLGMVVITLMWVGANQVEAPYYAIGQFSTFFFFFFFFFIIYYIKFWDFILN